MVEPRSPQPRGPSQTVMNTRTVRSYAHAIACVLALAACGGGDDEDTGGTTLPPAPTLAFSAAASNVPSGGSTTLNWSSTDVTACTASGAWSGSKPGQGSES